MFTIHGTCPAAVWPSESTLDLHPSHLKEENPHFVLIKKHLKIACGMFGNSPVVLMAEEKGEWCCFLLCTCAWPTPALHSISSSISGLSCFSPGQPSHPPCLNARGGGISSVSHMLPLCFMLRGKTAMLILSHRRCV